VVTTQDGAARNRHHVVMTPEQIARVRACVHAVDDRQDEFAKAIAADLAADPPPWSTDGVDPDGVARAAVTEMGPLVAALGDFPRLVGEVGRIREQYDRAVLGTIAETAMRSALMSGLRTVLGDAFTDDDVAAWGCACTLVAELLRRPESARNSQAALRRA
jgi:hypothetical protein